MPPPRANFLWVAGPDKNLRKSHASFLCLESREIDTEKDPMKAV